MIRTPQRGSTLVVVTVLILVFLLAMALLVAGVMGKAHLIQDTRKRNQSFYLAESGIRLASERLRVDNEREDLPRRFQVDFELAGGSFDTAAVRLDRPGNAPPGNARDNARNNNARPLYVVTSRGSYRGTIVTLAARGELWYDGLRIQRLVYGAAPPAWFDLEADERRAPRGRPRPE